MDDWKNKNYAFFQNRSCEFFPCHKGLKEEEFNCLFCWCPLYALGENCGGAYAYTETGVKDCSACVKPHKKETYGKILEKFSEIQKLAEKK